MIWSFLVAIQDGKFTGRKAETRISDMDGRHERIRRRILYFRIPVNELERVNKEPPNGHNISLITCHWCYIQGNSDRSPALKENYNEGVQWNK